MKILDFPSIVKFYGYSLKGLQIKDSITIFMQYAPNNSLRRYINSIRLPRFEKFSNTQLQIILIGISAGMQYMHSKNIMHRDLKPDNILLDENNYPLITDFGLAKYYKDDGTHTAGAGSPSYMAPEVIDGQKYDKSSDVYSFAITIYEFLTGLRAYNYINFFVLMNNVKKGARPSLDVEMKESFKDLIRRCYSENPDDRYSFDEITNMLVNDENYYLENIDVDKIKSYAFDTLKLKFK